MKTLSYARAELKRCFARVTDGEPEIELVSENTGHPFDDAYTIDVTAGKGRITGSNERSVLLGVYRFFYELGCRFIRPGRDGEIFVKKDISECTVKKSFRPENRYRGICDEGAISEKNVAEFAEWLPKIGMNSYFMQFTDGHLYFEKWYKHKGSSVLPPQEDYTSADSQRHYDADVKVIKKCGLIFQAVGHGWTTLPLGYPTYGDGHASDADIKPEHRGLFALIKGKRGFFRGGDAPGDSQLCYSNPVARNGITDAIADYLKQHGEVDVLHFWLADGMNNHCECEACQKRLPSEWYVTLLNELDEKLTALGIGTKIVFLIYCDLLFAPKDVTIHNPDRFILMYAPIARNFFEPLYTQENYNSEEKAPEYFRNNNNHPRTGGQYLHYLKEWQKVVKCDSFTFDYHLMTFQYAGDPSFTKISRTIYEDMPLLRSVGLNGNISCQIQRTFVPDALPNYVMAERLFGSERSFEEIEDECLQATFGEQAEKIKDFLHGTETFFLSDCVRKSLPAKERIPVIKEFQALVLRTEKELKFSDPERAVNVSLKNLRYFLGLMKRFVRVYLKKAEAGEIKEELFRYIDEQEEKVQPYEDSLFRKDGFASWI